MHITIVLNGATNHIRISLPFISKKAYIIFNMEKILLTCLLVILTLSRLFSQTYYVDEKHQKGYIKDGEKYKFWEYYDPNGELNLKFNHSNGSIIYLKPATEKYMIEVEGKWVYTKPSFPPTYIGSIVELRSKVAEQIRYPKSVAENGLTGYMFFSFIIDSLGNPVNFKIEKDLCEGCGNENLKVLITNMGSWIPAHIDGERYNSKFIFPIKYSLDGEKENEILPDSTRILYNGKLLDEVDLVAYGIMRSTEIPMDMNIPLSAFMGIIEYSDLQDALRNSRVAKILHLSSQNLKYFPNEIYKLHSLTQLNLRNNEIDSLPEDINKLRNIRVLALDSNKLNNLPVKFKNLHSLRVLSITNNNFENFPSEILSLKNLQALDISDNNITIIPAEIKQMRNLKSLAIINCEIKTFPEEFFQLKKLEKLYVNINQLDEITRTRLRTDFNNLEIIDE